jgi:hypothetical protein
MKDRFASLLVAVPLMPDRGDIRVDLLAFSVKQSAPESWTVLRRRLARTSGQEPRGLCRCRCRNSRSGWRSIALSIAVRAHS